ncbi:glycosyltransferase family 4 protein [Novosphingobium huizhouense]|uniref:glycosyltransferase family 4 protein n=1 Tax=Novosphingobium huizhouense TaxID=2866625 RepID=UPI001CD875AE|nr:glycosyltransferase family 4 protein [Novosphingobium huizhouense]
MTAPREGRLRLLHLHSTFGPGGKERRSVDLVNRFGPALEHAVVSAEPAALGAAQFVAPRIALEVLHDFPPLAGRPSVRRLQAIAQAMRGYDLLLSYNWGAMDAVMAHAVFAPHYGLAPLVHHEDGFNADEAAGLKPSRNWYRRIALTRASALVVPSRRLEQIARGAWRQGPAKVRRIANGIDTRAYGATPRPDVLPRVIKRPGERWVGTLAGLRPVKNLRRMVRAMASLPPEWQLVILGEGPEREAILAEAMALDIGHRVHLPGHVADPAQVIGLFDLFALSSDSEQFPLSVVEAMAAGLAVASPAVGDVAEIVDASNRPFITREGDEAAFAAALATLAADEELRHRLGTANRKRAQGEFDAARMVERYGAVYARALGMTHFP